jgi:hypothetical protein
MSEFDERVRSVADEIARYLDWRPGASDTEEGVRRWWIPQVRLEEEVIVVRDALALLVAQGAVERVVLPSGLVMFRRPPQHPTAGNTTEQPAAPVSA